MCPQFLGIWVLPLLSYAQIGLYSARGLCQVQVYFFFMSSVPSPPHYFPSVLYIFLWRLPFPYPFFFSPVLVLAPSVAPPPFFFSLASLFCFYIFSFICFFFFIPFLQLLFLLFLFQLCLFLLPLLSSFPSSFLFSVPATTFDMVYPLDSMGTVDSGPSPPTSLFVSSFSSHGL